MAGGVIRATSELPHGRCGKLIPSDQPGTLSREGVGREASRGRPAGTGRPLHLPGPGRRPAPLIHYTGFRFSTEPSRRSFPRTRRNRLRGGNSDNFKQLPDQGAGTRIATDRRARRIVPDMARQKKPSGRPNKGPWSPDHIIKALKADGWEQCTSPPHSQWEHQTRPGKITVDTNWSNGVKTSDDVFGYMATQGGYSKKEFVALMNSV